MVLLASPAGAQKLNPVQWSLSFEPASAPPGSVIAGRLTAKLEAGWHLYSLTTPRPPIATTITLAASEAVESLQVYQPRPKRKFDPNFGAETETYEGDTLFFLQIKLKSDAAAGPVELTAQTRYQACNDKICLPPVRKTASATLTVDPAAKSPQPAVPAGYGQFEPPASGSSPAPRPQASAPQGWGSFLMVAFGFGLAAIFTPCVFPMIPITMSFFLNRPSGSRGESVFQAALFCLGIIVLFSALGLATTALTGPFGVVQLGSNPWVNGFIALVFLAFGLSLLGAFEITLPSVFLTRLNRASERGGVAGTLVMGLTFSLTSFACVGPFVGTLLAASIQSGGLQPALGMVSFAAGLALPFFVLALFPSYLKRLPKSGGWLVRVKVVLAFLILAAMLKYLSNIDQVMQWNLLTRERFLAAWVVLFAAPGLYLLGVLRLEGVRPEENVGVGRLLTGVLFLTFALSMVPGMFGTRLGEIEAYVPPPPAQASGPQWMRNQYREALEAARRDHKLVFVNFTGYACTNCHWMKANMFGRPEIAAQLNNYILVELYTDGTDDTSRINQQFQESRFSTIAIPFYAIVDPDEKVLATFPGLTRDAGEFLSFLRSARPRS